MEREMESREPSTIDLNAELAKLTMFRGRTMADRKGSGARLAAYRDGVLFATKFAGKGHWERHPTGDELIYVLDGTGTLEIVGEDGSPVFRAPRRSDRCQSAGYVAPISLFGGRDGNVRDAQSQRAYQPRCRRPSGGRALVDKISHLVSAL
jgi:hypothetical protein